MSATPWKKKKTEEEEEEDLSAPGLSLFSRCFVLK
jgi:hypothetical protein